MIEPASTEPAAIAEIRRTFAEPRHSAWLDITQDRITAFGGITLDFDPDHLDPVQAARGQFGIAVNQGFLTLSLLTHFLETVGLPQHRNHLNYGLDRVRWTAPVPVGKRIRARFELAAVESKGADVYQMAFDVTVEIESQPKPAMLARWLTRVAV